MKNTVKKNSAKRTLAGILATASLAAVMLPTAAVMVPGITAHAGYVTELEQIPDNMTFSSCGVGDSDPNIIYPGAMLEANRDLVTGNPTPIRLLRRPVSISISGAVMKDGCKSIDAVDPTSASVVNDAIRKELDGNFREGTDCAAQITTKIEKVESDDQIKAEMNFSNEMWANLKTSAFADYHKNEQCVVVDISQVFYTVAADVQTSADLFPDEMKLSRIQRYIKPDSPAVVVSSVDYGKRVVACIQTSDMSFDLKASISASGLGGKVKGGAEGSYDTKLKNCTVNLFVAGGSSENAGEYFKNISIDKLLETAASQTKYDGYAVPVSYTTRWAHDGSIATAAYHGYSWQTVTTKQLATKLPVTVKFNQIDRDNIKSLNVKVFGKRIQSIDNNSAFILGEEELIGDYTRDFNGDLYFELDASVSKDTVRFVFDYTGNAGTQIDEKYRTVYLADLARQLKTSYNPKLAAPDASKKSATAEDFETLTVNYNGYGPHINVSVSGKMSKDFGEEVKEMHADLLNHIEIQSSGRPTGNKI